MKRSPDIEGNENYLVRGRRITEFMRRKIDPLGQNGSIARPPLAASWPSFRSAEKRNDRGEAIWPKDAAHIWCNWDETTFVPPPDDSGTAKFRRNSAGTLLPKRSRDRVPEITIAGSEGRRELSSPRGKKIIQTSVSGLHRLAWRKRRIGRDECCGPAAGQSTRDMSSSLSNRRALERSIPAGINCAQQRRPPNSRLSPIGRLTSYSC